MKFLLANWRLIALAAIIAGAFGSGWTINQWRHDAEKKAEVEAKLAASKENSELILSLELKRNENTKINNDLRADLAAERVRVPKLCVPNNASTGSADAAASSGSKPIDAQAAFEKFRRGLESDAYGADEMIEQCRVLRDWAASFN